MFHGLRKLFTGKPTIDNPLAVNLEVTAQDVKQRGDACLSEGKLDEAIKHYLHALMLDPQFAEAHNNLGYALKEQGKTQEAMGQFLRAIELKPELASPYFNLAKILYLHGKVDEAIVNIQHALSRNPEFAEAHFDLGSIFIEQGKMDIGILHLRKSTELAPDQSAAYAGLGAALNKLGKFQEACDALLRAISLDPKNYQAHLLLGYIKLAQGMISSAQTHIEQALIVNPDYPEAEFNLALLLLLQGELDSGWSYFESRWKAGKYSCPSFNRPLWRGEDIAGKNLFVYFEHGFGDTLQFARYISLLASRGAHVIFGCQRELAKLLASVEGIGRIEGMNTLDEIVAFGNSCTDFDYHFPLLSLPRMFQTTLATIPCKIPYVHADVQKVALWKEKLATEPRRKIGLVWRGNEANFADSSRSVPLEQFKEIFKLPGMQFFSLQKPVRESLSDYGVLDFTEQFNDFSDTAAFCENLDLIISVDTSVAHLAGSMGKPVWLLNRFQSEWRWLLQRDDSPWYPTMRIYRQKSLGDWASVISKVADDLRGVAKE